MKYKIQELKQFQVCMCMILIRIAASYMEYNAATIVQQKKQFYKSRCKLVAEQRK